MSKQITLRNVSPLGYLDVPILGRQGPAPSYADCVDCAGDPLSDHEHEIDETTKQHDEPGVGCLKPGEEFTTTEEIGKRLLEQTGNFELVKSTTEKKAG